LTPGQTQRRQKIAMGSCPLKITTKHFEATLQKIKRRTIAINNSSLVYLNIKYNTYTRRFKPKIYDH
jgi:hypothetical protein